MKEIKILFVFLLVMNSGVLIAQNAQIKKADKLYKLNQYNSAIGLYEQGLAEDESLSAQTKLAYCYRMTNKLAKAEELYAKIVTQDRAKVITLLYYGEALMGNGQYDEAKKWFLAYAEKSPNDLRGKQMALACDKVRDIKPFFNQVTLNPFEHNSDIDESSPMAFGQGIVFTSDRGSGKGVLKQKSGWTGRAYQRIFFSERDRSGKFSKVKSFSKKLNEINKHCGPVSFSREQNEVILTRTSVHPGRNDTYNMQLYSSSTTDGKKWKKASLLSFCKKEHNYMHPALSPDGQSLYFISDRPGGLGGTDLYVSKRKGDRWGRPENLGPEVNTAGNEGFPFVAIDGKLFFCSKGHVSFGGFDIFFTIPKDGTWMTPVNVGAPINSSYDDISLFMYDDEARAWFASSRDGGDDDIYEFEWMPGEWIPEEKPMAEETHQEPSIEEPAPSKEENWVVEPVEEPLPASQIKSDIQTAADQNKPRIEPVAEEMSIMDLPPSEEEPVIVTNPPVEEIVIEKPPIEKVENLPMEEVKEEIVVEAPVEVAPVENNIPPAQAVAIREPIKEVKEKKEKASLLIRSKKRKRVIPTETSQTTIAQVETVEEEEDSPFLEEVIPPENTVSTSSQIIEPEEKPYEAKLPYEGSSLQIVKEETHLVSDEPVVISDVQEDILEAKGGTIPPPALMDNELKNLDGVDQIDQVLQSQMEIENHSFRLTQIAYTPGSTLLSGESTRALLPLVDLLKRYPNLRVEISGHTSSLGENGVNQKLSEQRAQAIVAYLMYKGIDRSRLAARGYGETQLLNECTDSADCSPEAHKINERMEVKVLGK